MAKNGVCHVEWNSTDLERTSSFYGKLFGWTFEPHGGEYLLFRAPGEVGGGFAKTAEVTPGRSPNVYIYVDDIETYLQRAVELGGGIVMPKTEIQGAGWCAFLNDPDGNHVGLYQDGQG